MDSTERADSTSLGRLELREFYTLLGQAWEQEDRALARLRVAQAPGVCPAHLALCEKLCDEARNLVESVMHRLFASYRSVFERDHAARSVRVAQRAHDELVDAISASGMGGENGGMVPMHTVAPLPGPLSPLLTAAPPDLVSRDHARVSSSEFSSTSTSAATSAAAAAYAALDIPTRARAPAPPRCHPALRPAAPLGAARAPKGVWGVHKLHGGLVVMRREGGCTPPGRGATKRARVLVADILQGEAIPPKVAARNEARLDHLLRRSLSLGKAGANQSVDVPQ